MAKIISNRISKYEIDKGFIGPEQLRFRNREECICLYPSFLKLYVRGENL